LERNPGLSRRHGNFVDLRESTNKGRGRESKERAEEREGER